MDSGLIFPIWLLSLLLCLVGVVLQLWRSLQGGGWRSAYAVVVSSALIALWFAFVDHVDLLTIIGIHVLGGLVFIYFAIQSRSQQQLD